LPFNVSVLALKSDVAYQSYGNVYRVIVFFVDTVYKQKRYRRQKDLTWSCGMLNQNGNFCCRQNAAATVTPVS